MKTMNEIRIITATKEYEKDFWNAMRFRPNADLNMRDAKLSDTGSFYAPIAENAELRKTIEENCEIRSLSTAIRSYDGGSVIWAADSEDYAEFVPENETIPGFNVEDDFTKFRVGSHKLAGLVKLTSDFAYDAGFDLKGYINERMGKSFARAEDRAFINGTGINEPTGLLHATDGAEIGVTTASLKYDDVVELFFSVKPEYRKKGVWLMNDRTALALRKLKDNDGNYLWNVANDTILGKPVRICNEMPDAEAGAKPVLFGDFRFYWITDRSPISLMPIKELFALSGRVGYLGFEFLDARLVRREAVKAIEVSSN